MKAAEANFLKFLKKSDQLAIPIYQRTYSWTRAECLQLWSDVVRASHHDVSGHFIGSIVYIDTGIYQVTGANAIQVIDGQQRLTTISLLLLAVARSAEADGDDSGLTPKKLIKDYLLQDDDEDEGDEARYKLLLTRGDCETLMRLVDGNELNGEAPRLIDNYLLFEEQIRKTPLSLAEIFAGIEKLVIVDISLERDHDNPQLIFESLNSTGLDLSQADLIRNYALMGQAPKQQAEIYTKSWFPLEQSFPDEPPELFDRFVRDYLTMKTGQIPRIDQVYESFKAFSQTGESSIAELVADVYHHSKHWVKLAFGRTEDHALREVLGDLSQLKVDVAFPFLMDVLEDYEQAKITHGELIEVVRLVESYVFRRAIAGIPANILNKTFAGLAREVDEANYMESLKAALLLKESYARMPGDEEFRREFVVKDVYNFRSRNYLLRKLENHDRKERVDVDSFTIEHVMPQNPELSPEWQDELGPDWQTVQERYLHTIGNLTLTGYNSELSDRPFSEKLIMKGGFRDSPLRLNGYLAKLEHWNEQEIEQRGERLADLALQVWPAPDLPEETLAKYRTSKVKLRAVYSLDDHPALKGEVEPVFTELRKRVLNLDVGVSEEVKKQYVGYKLATNFVDVIPLKSELRLILNTTVEELDDPNELARDISKVGHWGNGNVEVRLASLGELDEVMELLRQSFEKQSEEGFGEPQWSHAGVERVVERASDTAVQDALLEVVDSAVRNGLYPRPWKYSLMFAPQANRSRALFTLTVRDDDRVDLLTVPEAFESFFALDPLEVGRQLGPAGSTTLQAEETAALADRLDELMVDAQMPEELTKPAAEWNGRDFYVSFGEDKRRNWQDAVRYGFISGGGARWYSQSLENLEPSHRVFVNIPNRGFVGVGEVVESVKPVSDFFVEIDGVSVPILEAPLAAEQMGDGADDDARSEYLVRIDWLCTLPIEQAFWEKGMFANQNTACRLQGEKGEFTIERVTERMGIHEPIPEPEPVQP